MEEERGVNELSPALASKLPQGTSEENGQDILKKKINFKYFERSGG